MNASSTVAAHGTAGSDAGAEGAGVSQAVVTDRLNTWLGSNTNHAAQTSSPSGAAVSAVEAIQTCDTVFASSGGTETSAVQAVGGHADSISVSHAGAQFK